MPSTDARSPDAATVPGFGVRPWRDGLDEEIEADQEYEGLPCIECGVLAFPPNYECGCALR